MPKLGRLLFNSPFDGPAGTAPNQAQWNLNTGRWGAGAGELQYYVGGNAMVRNGALWMWTRREPTPDGKPEPFNYTSAMLTTLGLAEFTPPVRIEANIKLPIAPKLGSNGLLPAFWTRGHNPAFAKPSWLRDGEIDILEQPGKAGAQGFVASTLHGAASGDLGREISTGNTYRHDGSLQNVFHRYAMDWWPDRIDFRTDTVVTKTITRETHEAAGGDWTPFSGAWPHYLILNVAVGNPYSGPPTIGAKFPALTLVGYVKAWQLLS